MNVKKSSLKIATAALISLPCLVVSSCANKEVVKKQPEVIKVKPNRTAATPRSVQYPFGQNPPVSLSAGTAKGVSHYRGSKNLPYIALTFDDGPHAVHTPKLLDTLAAHNVKATFYVTGQNATRYPGLIRRMVSEGHEVGNHTFSHPNLTRLSDSQVRSQIDRSIVAIVNAAGVKPRTFRPPYAAMTSRQRAWVNAQYGYPIVFWSVDPRDWKDRNASIVKSRIMSGTSKGSIILLHDIHGTSVRAVPQTINGLLAKGYQFVTVSQLLATK